MIVTIDGHAGTGKSCVAKIVANKLNFTYYDTGAMYRAITYLVIQNKVPINKNIIKGLLKTWSFKITINKNAYNYIVNGEDVSEQIRSLKVTQLVSEISALDYVRKALLKMQRKLGKNSNAVFEGRDMGTVVFPHAEVKIFLTATAEIRAKRRYLELKNKTKTSLQKVLDDIIRRDNYDTSRKTSPLKPAKDAFFVDSSCLSIDDVVNIIMDHINNLFGNNL